MDEISLDTMHAMVAFGLLAFSLCVIGGTIFGWKSLKNGNCDGFRV